MRTDAATYHRLVAPLLDEFMTRKNGRVFSPRLREEFEKADETYRRRSEAGKKGGRPKAIEKPAKEAKAGLSREKAGPKQPEPEPEPEREEKKDTRVTALDHLSPVIGSELASAFIAHRKALRAPMTEHAGKLMAAKLSSMNDPPGAVARSIEHGWKGVFEQTGNVAHINGRKSNAERFDDAFNDLTARLSVQRLE
jgi:hypothetical protein